MKRISTGWVILAVILITGIPYLVAFRAAGADSVFGGFLLNPIDGNSYLAKMYEGWAGNWKFTLPYTAQPGDGAYLFLFYLFLGHLARWLHLPLLMVFHVIRLFGIAALEIALYRFMKKAFRDPADGWKAFLLATFGSGIGWLVFAAGLMTSDFWVAETYPILSSYANPHFPIGLALLLMIFTQDRPVRFDRHALLLGLASLLLAIILPFGVVVAGVVLAGVEAWIWLDTRHLHWKKIAVVGGFSLPVMVYELWATLSDPIMAGWNAQNVTTSPAIWDLVLSLSPALLLALWGIKVAFQRRSDFDRLLIVWSVLGILLIYLPFGLQRRFMLGLYIPLAALAVSGLGALIPANRPRFNTAYLAMFILSVPTTLVVFLAGFSGVMNHDANIYLTKGEVEAMDWIAENTPTDALIAASPDTGLLIPAYTGRHVIYGHPFETVDAKNNEKDLIALFSGDINGSTIDFLTSHGTDYVWIGPRELALGTLSIPDDYPIVYDQNGVTIIQVPE